MPVFYVIAKPPKGHRQSFEFEETLGNGETVTRRRPLERRITVQADDEEHAKAIVDQQSLDLTTDETPRYVIDSVEQVED